MNIFDWSGQDFLLLYCGLAGGAIAVAAAVRSWWRPPGEVPRNLLLQPARSIADWNPMSLVVEGIRDPIIQGLSWSSLGKGLGGIAIFMVIGALWSAAAMRRRLAVG